MAEPPDAVGYVRFVQPFQVLDRLGYRLRTLGGRLRLLPGPGGARPDPALLDGVDLVLVPQMVAAPTLPSGERLDLVGWVLDHARDRGVPVVYALDDHPEHLGPSNPGYEAALEWRPTLRSLRAEADGFLVSTPALGEAFQHPRRPLRVVPNMVDPRRWGPRVSVPGNVRLGWAGSASHLEDLREILPALERLRRRMAFTLVVFGLVNRPLGAEIREVRVTRPHLRGYRRERAELFLEVAGRLEALGCVHVPFVRLEAYFRVLPGLGLDVAVAPLSDSPFNRFKSALKYYEYAMAGAASVASAVGPYEGEPELLTCPNEDAAWEQTLEALLRDAPRRRAVARRQSAWVRAHRDIARGASLWDEALQAFLRAPVRSNQRGAEAAS